MAKNGYITYIFTNHGYNETKTWLCGKPRLISYYLGMVYTVHTVKMVMTGGWSMALDLPGEYGFEQTKLMGISLIAMVG